MGVQILAVLLHHGLQFLRPEVDNLVLVGIYQRHEFVVRLHYQALANHWHGVEFVFNLLGIDILSAGTQQHVFDTSANVNVLVGIHGAQVAGVIPSVLVQDLTGGLFVVIITQHHVQAACHYLTGNVFRVIAQYLHFHIVDGTATRAGSKLLPVAVTDQRRTLRGTIAHGNGKTDAQQELLHLFRQRRATHNDLVSPAAKGFVHLLVDAVFHFD